MTRSTVGLFSVVVLLSACSAAEHGAEPPLGSSEYAIHRVPSAAPSAAASIEAPITPPAVTASYTSREIPLPGGDEGGVSMDYLAYSARSGLLWVPAGNTGSVFAIQTSTDKLNRIEGFPTATVDRNGKKRTVGPSSVTVGDKGVYIGDRADSTVCMVDETSLKKGACGKLNARPDGLAFIAGTNEVWVTTPEDRSLRILDGSSLKEKAKISFDGQPEGYAVDSKRGRFYMNLEDSNVTLSIDLKSHQVNAKWSPTCASESPHGLRLDEEDGILFAACSEETRALDVEHGGAVLSSIPTGDGVDDLDYVASTRTLYVGASKSAKLTVAKVDKAGKLTVSETVPTKEGARNGVVDSSGQVFLAVSKAGELLVARPR